MAKNDGAADDGQNAAEEAAADDGLVAMTDGQVKLRLHPDCVEDHRKLGWVPAV